MPPPPSSRLSLPRRGPWLALLSVVVIGAMPFVVCPRLEKARAETSGEEALHALASCLGEPRDDATLRARAITAQLAGEDWPARCREAASHLEVALAALQRLAPPRCQGRCCADDAGCRATGEARAALGQLREAIDGGRFATGSAERLFEASAVALTPAPPATGEVPAVTSPRRPRDDQALARGGYDVAALVGVADGTWRLLLHARDKHAVICDVDPTAASARCAPLPPSIPIADRVLLVDGVPDAPLSVLAREDDAIAPERWAIYDATSGERKLAIDHDALGATVSRDGAAAALVHDGRGYFLIAGGAEPVPVDVAKGSLGPPLLFGPWLVTADARPEGGAVVSVRALDWRDGTPRLADAATIATLQRWRPTAVAMQGCRSGATSVLALTAEPPEPEPTVVVAVHDGQAWHHAVAEVDSPWFGLACDGEGATLTEVSEDAASPTAGGHRGRYAIARQRCTTTGCTRERAAIEITRWRPASRYLATSLGDEVALIWRSGLGDVRLAAAPAPRLEGATPRVLFEGDDHGGYDFDRHGAELLARDGRALLLVADESAGGVGTHAVLIAPDGTARPLTVTP